MWKFSPAALVRRSPTRSSTRRSSLVVSATAVAAAASNGPGWQGDTPKRRRQQLNESTWRRERRRNAAVVADASDKGAGNALAVVPLTSGGEFASAGDNPDDRAGSERPGRMRALNGGSGVARASAIANLDANSGNVVIAGSASAAARAHNLSGPGSSGLAASADAELGVTHTPDLTVGGVAGARASAVNSGSGAGAVNAQAHISADSTLRNITLGGVSIVVDASNLAIGNSRPGCSGPRRPSSWIILP